MLATNRPGTKGILIFGSPTEYCRNGVRSEPTPGVRRPKFSSCSNRSLNMGQSLRASGPNGFDRCDVDPGTVKPSSPAKAGAAPLISIKSCGSGLVVRLGSEDRS